MRAQDNGRSHLFKILLNDVGTLKKVCPSTETLSTILKHVCDRILFLEQVRSHCLVQTEA